MIIKEMPESERPREKMLQHGPGALSSCELIAAIIGNGTGGRSALDIAESLLTRDEQGIGFLGRCSIEEILCVEGIGKAKGCQLMAAVELGKRLAAVPLRERQHFDSPEAIASYFMATMRYLREEHFRLLLLDVQGGMISVEEIGIGSLMGVEIHPRDVFSTAIRKNAAAIVAVHNHPSGNPAPSEEDVELTRRIGLAGKIIGIPLMEHLIIGDGTYESLKYMD